MINIILGGINDANVPAEEIIPEAKLLSYPSFLISGNVIFPKIDVAAIDAPEIAPKPAAAMQVAIPTEPGIQLQHQHF